MIPYYWYRIGETFHRVREYDHDDDPDEDSYLRMVCGLSVPYNGQNYWWSTKEASDRPPGNVLCKECRRMLMKDAV